MEVILVTGETKCQVYRPDERFKTEEVVPRSVESEGEAGKRKVYQWVI